MTEHQIQVTSEIAPLRRLLIHSPDSGLGKIVPSKAQDWLFEDIIHLDKMQREEYDYYVKILLYFLDKEKVQGKIAEIDKPANNRSFYKPHSPAYFKSDKVLDPQYLLTEVLENREIRLQLVSAICAVENCSFTEQDVLLKLESIPLAKTLITGSLPEGKLIFPPVPNFIFTRDIGIVINNHILLNRPAKVARMREALMMKYIFFHHPTFADYRDNIIEIKEQEQQFFLPDDEKESNAVTLEGGDVMTISHQHLLIGISERTSKTAVNRVIETLFEKNIVKKVTVIQIPAKRDFMHIDTVFTQVKKNVWVLFAQVFDTQITQNYLDTHSNQKKREVKITQFQKEKPDGIEFENIEELLTHVSREDLGFEGEIEFIYSGNKEFPYASREQWTDSCNVLALKEGVVLGYDRNTHTANAFEEKGFRVINAKDLLDKFESGELSPETLTDTLILLPSAELSRARGGSHCMSLPLLRDEL